LGRLTALGRLATRLWPALIHAYLGNVGLIEKFIPPRKNNGRPRTTSLRDVWDAIQYMATAGCQWAMIPNDFPPPFTVQRYFY